MKITQATKSSTVSAFVVAVLLASAPALPAYAAETHTFAVSDTDSTAAIQDFATQSGVQILATAAAVKDKRFNSVKGEYSIEDGLNVFLSGTGLMHKYMGDRAVALLPASQASSDGASTDASPSEVAPSSLWDRFRLAQATQGVSAETTSVENGEQTSQRGAVRLEEVVVTAQKKSENLMDVPMPVSVLNADQLADNGQVLLRDYFTSVPGLSLTAGVHGTEFLSIRGISTGQFTNPTVGIVVDDVPFGGSTNTLAEGELPDIDPGDLARVEVLRGPQGTLYGADSMGGLLKYVTVDPSTSGLSARIEGGTNFIQNGAQPGYNFRAAINVPLSDTLAIRASAFKRQDAGYIDNPVLHENGVNEAEAYGARLSALWRPSGNFSLKVSALYQDTKADGSSDVNVPTAGYAFTAGLSGLQQNYIRGIGGSDRRAQVYTAVLKANLGGVDLTSVTGYNISRFSNSEDFTWIYAQDTQNQFGVSGTPLFNYDESDKLTQEVRLSASIGTRLEWLLGGFYTKETAKQHQIQSAEDANTGQIVGQWAFFNYPRSFQESAAFADLTYHITDRFDVQIGGRESHTSETDDETDSGPYVSVFEQHSSPYVYPQLHSTGEAFTYLLTPRFKISPDLMVYARIASGYRPGGPNAAFAIADGAPRKFDPDKTQNYELGVKGDFLSHTLSVDASLYYIDWKKIQIFESNGIAAWNGNGNSAKSEGVELSAVLKPLARLSIDAWITYSNAVLTRAFPADATAYGVPGDRLPNSPRISANLSITENFPLSNNVTGFVAGTASYVGNQASFFTGSPGMPAPRQTYPSYTKTDLRTGFRYNSWTGTLYANNIANVRAVLTGGAGSFPAFVYQYIQPRTIGLSISKTLDGGMGK